jgi:hypothetical protein
MELREGKQSTNYKKEDAYIRAQKRLKEIKGFYWHAFWYVVVNIFLLIMIIPNSSGNNWWHFGTFSTPIFWGIGLAFHALGVFGKNLIFGKAWEDRKIQEFMDKDKRRRK